MSARVILVGFGTRGRQWREVADARSDCRVAGIVDCDDDALVVARAAGLTAWPSLDDALTTANASAAIIASPPALHATHALACLGAGLPVLVEKPLALSLRDAAAIADAADAAGAKAVVAHNFRHRTLERTVRRALAAGYVGELRAASIVTARPAPSAASELPANAALWDLGVHHLDLLRVRLGSVPELAQAHCWPSAGGLTLALHLEWASGAAADYWLREGGCVYHHAEWLEGDRGALRAVDGRAWLVTPDRRPRRLRARRGPGAERVLLDALLDGDARTVDARESLGTIAMVEAAAGSLALDQPVRLAELPTDQGVATA